MRAIRAAAVRTLACLALLGAGSCGGGGGPSTNSLLASLVLSVGDLSPDFSPAVTVYSVGPALLAGAVRITATTASGAATVTVSGIATASGSPSADIALPLGSTPVLIVVTAQDGTSQTAYTVAFQRALTGQQAYVKASNTGAGDLLGSEVGLAGPGLALDGDTLVVGAPLEDGAATGVNGDQADNTAPDSGAAYVYVRVGTTWTFQAYLKASNTGASDAFGASVAISGDTIAVSAPLEDSAATGVNGSQADNTVAESGAVYVFTRSGSAWAQQAYLKASNTGPADQFGLSLGLSGDTLVVGAPAEASVATGVFGIQGDNSAPGAGAAYVFVRTGKTWAQQVYLKASNTAAGDRFGASVGVAGETVAVGAIGEASAATGVNGSQADNTAADAGAVYVFVRTGAAWSQQAYLKASNTGAGDVFGNSLSLDRDTLVVAAAGEDSIATGVNGNQADNTAVESGAAYVFARAGATWTQQAYLKASNAAASDRFAVGVRIEGDALVVGAPNEDSAATGLNGNQGDDSAVEGGAAYLFTRTGGVWAVSAYLKASNTQTGDRFGAHVALAGGTIAVSAESEDSNATGLNGNQADNSASGAGAVYVFR